MKNTILFISSIIIVVFGVALNIVAIVVSSTPSLLNVVVTICFLAFWGVFIYMSRNSKILLAYSAIVGGMTLLTALFVLVININNLTSTIGIPFTILFLAPLYGVSIISNRGFILSSIAEAVISTVWVASSVLLLIRTRRA